MAEYISTLVHLHVQIGGRWCIACNPNDVPSTAKIPANVQQITGDPSASNCPLCRKTEIYRTTLDKFEGRSPLRPGIPPAEGG